MPVRIKVPRTGRVKKPNLDQASLTFIGKSMVNEQKLRWSKGITADDHVKPLSKKYTFIKKKVRNVHRPIRDMHLSGATIANFQLRKAIGGVIRAENTTRETRRRAQGAQQYAQMIGFSQADLTNVFAVSQLEYGKQMKHAWIPVSG